MKYQKKQKMFIVMTQNRRPVSQCFLWLRVVFTEIWDFLFFFFFFQVPLQKKKKKFLPNLLNTTEKAKFPESKVAFVYSCIHFLLDHTDLLSFEIFSFL